jgi:NhaP-type Na+/H+ and K+/H+ antiporter
MPQRNNWKPVAKVLLRWVGLGCIFVLLAAMAFVGPEGLGALLFSVALLIGEAFRWILELG